LYFHVEHGILAFAKFKSPRLYLGVDEFSEKFSEPENYSPNPVMLPKNENKKMEIVED